MKFLNCSQEYLQQKMNQYTEVALQVKEVMDRCNMQNEEEGFKLAKELILNNEKLPFHICLSKVLKEYLRDIGKWISVFITFIIGILSCMAANDIALLKTYNFWCGVLSVFLIGFAIEIAINCSCKETEKLNITILNNMSFEQFSFIIRRKNVKG